MTPKPESETDPWKAIQRYEFVQTNFAYTTDHEMERDAEGEWARWEAVDAARAAEAAQLRGRSQVAMRDKPSPELMRALETLGKRPVQPPATPQEPNRPDLDTVTELWRRQMYPAIDRALFVECFNDRANPGWQVVRDEVSAVRAVLLHFALPAPPTPEGTEL